MVTPRKEDAIELCIRTNRRAIRALIATADECRAALEAHARMKDADAEASRLVERIRSDA